VLLLERPWPADLEEHDAPALLRLVVQVPEQGVARPAEGEEEGVVQHLGECVCVCVGVCHA
jgi:hypothetical protein